MFIYCICTQHLVGAPFALITASIRRGMEVISLWHCWGGMEAQVSLTVAFRSSALLGLVSLIFLLTIPHRFSMWLGSPFSWRRLSVVTLDALTPASVHSLWSSHKCLNQLCLTVFSSLRSSLLLVHLFLPKFFLPVNFAFNMLWYSTL